MRTRLFGMVAALLLIAAGARAQGTLKSENDPQKDTPKAPAAATLPEFGNFNRIDIGLRGTTYGDGSDQARFQRYRDMSDGGTLDAIRYFKDTSTYRLNLQGDHVGYQDQRFYGAYNNFGRVKASFEWLQVPLYYSGTTQSLYTANNGILALPSGVQLALQNKTTTLANVLSTAPSFDMRVKRNNASANLVYNPATDVDLRISFLNQNRSGSQPLSGPFGFSAMTDELAVPIQYNTTDFGTSVGYGNANGFVKVAYEGSFFRNDLNAVTWANPLRATDSATAGPANGSMSLAPDTDRNTVTASGGLNRLPGRTHVNAFLSYGVLSNNDRLIPWTVNSALPSPALPRTNADVTAHVTAMNFAATSRPIDHLFLNARYREYKYDNQTPIFASATSISYDYSIAGAVQTEPISYTRHTFDGDMMYSPFRHLGVRGGYTFAANDQPERWVPTTHENIGRASVDLTGFSYFSARAIYEYAKKTGERIEAAEILAEGEQPALGHYDIANRNRQRTSGVFTYTPIGELSFTGTVGWLKDEYPASQFGLTNNANLTYSIGFDAVPIENRLTFGATYGRDKNDATQGSRYAAHVATGVPPTFFNPLADWWDDSSDLGHAVDVSADILKVVPKTDVKLAYSYSHTDSNYVYSVRAGSVVPTTNVPLPDVHNELNRGTVDVMYHITSHLGAGMVYWYDSYSVNDFNMGPLPLAPGPAASPAMMMIGYNYRPYTANTFWGRLTYFW